MRKAVSTLLILFVAVSGSESAAKNLQSDVLSQTTDWLKKMIATHSRYVRQYSDGSTLENHLEDIEFDTCTFTYRDVTSSQRNGRITQEQVFTFIVPLAELDVARFRIEIWEQKPKLILKTIDDKQAIKGTAWWEVDRVGKAATQESANQSLIVIPFDSLEAAETLSKYLMQAVKLCQNRERQ